MVPPSDVCCFVNSINNCVTSTINHRIQPLFKTFLNAIDSGWHPAGQDDVPEGTDLQDLLHALPFWSGPGQLGSAARLFLLGRIWAFPEMGVPRFIIHFLDGMFHYKPSSVFGVSPFLETSRCSIPKILQVGSLVFAQLEIVASPNFGGSTLISVQDFFKQSTTRLYFILDKNYVPRRKFDLKICQIPKVCFSKDPPFFSSHWIWTSGFLVGGLEHEFHFPGLKPPTSVNNSGLLLE
jgi:hypothetical protein